MGMVERLGKVCTVVGPPPTPLMERGPYLIRVSMTEVEPVLDFASSGRTGRRNALPDILGSPAGVSPSDLPLKLAEMSLSAGSSQEMQSPSAEVPPPQPQSPELKDTS
ncbi:cAMP-dependent protein kinase inhibitor beta-like [Phasianus colchicus]|uniref:cAMP-dependent protein kinase inhibitor beta-like n=1 Tax=Phasianus colchicus TaxID=9054 RepID=UPI00129EDA71|nr:cAMP-dependent protein kinase inhibitor beta-like [Phasianus colchicus]